MATRKSAPQALSFDIEGSAKELPDIIAQLSAAPGTHTLNFAPNGATLKAVTDRIRRIPRQRGLNALTVKAAPADGGGFVLSVTNTGKTAIPWPKPAAKSTKSTKKAPAKAAAKSTKSTAKKAPAKRAPRKAAAPKLTVVEDAS